MRFEWDLVKAAANLAKHGIAFEDAARVFDDPLQRSRQDRTEGGELRWQTLGMAGGTLVLLLVAHTWQDDDDEEVIRIISARTANKRVRLERAAAMPDSEIDTSDIPEAPLGAWAGAEVGRFYRPRKEVVTIRLDADLIEHFKRQAGGRGYQTAINAALRAHVGK